MSKTSSEYVGVLLCGGKSSRMGMDKAFISMPSSTSAVPLFLHLLQTVFDPLEHLSHIVISARDTAQQYRIKTALLGHFSEKKVEVHLDDPAFAERGPASGIISAHLLRPEATLVVLGVDFPQAEAQAFRDLIASHEADPTAPVTLFLHPEDGNPEPVMSIWSPEAVQRLVENTQKGKSGPCFTAKQLWKDKHPEGGLSKGHGLVEPSKHAWVVDADTPEEWAKVFGNPPEAFS